MQGKSKPTKEPMILRIPLHNFTDAKNMEDALLPFEACFARIPNIKQEGFKEHVAFVYKDGDGKVYSTAMVQHHGVLKDTPENRDFAAKVELPKEKKKEEKGELKWSKK